MYLDSGDVDDLRKMSRLSLEMKKEKRKAYNSILAQERGLELWRAAFYKEEKLKLNDKWKPNTDERCKSTAKEKAMNAFDPDPHKVRYKSLCDLIEELNNHKIVVQVEDKQAKETLSGINRNV